MASRQPWRPALAHAVVRSMRRHPIFTALSRDQVRQMLRTGRVETLAAGQQLYARGDASDRFFLVLEGQVNLSLHSPDGAEKIIDMHTPGQVFAEAVAFMERPVYQMTATAATAARVQGFLNQVYIGLLQQDPGACMRVIRHLSSRLHDRIREIEGIALQSATSRLVRLLDARLPADDADQATLHLRETRQELAAYLAIKPETLSRTLRALTDSGAIVVRGRTIGVPSRARLRRYLDELGDERRFD